MAIYLVNQGKTYKRERTGGYVLVESGLQNRGSSLMQEIHKGDFLIHNYGGRLSAISVVQEDCKSGDRQIYTRYYEFTTPINNTDLVEWVVQNYKQDSAFQADGKFRLRFICNLANSHAEYLLQMAIGLEIKAEVTSVLQAALMEVKAASSAAGTHSDIHNLKDPLAAVSDGDTTVTEESAVLHKKYGEGTVIQIANDKIYVKFGCGQRIFKFPEAFEKKWLIV